MHLEQAQQLQSGTSSARRSTAQVLEAHLEYRRIKDLERDLAENYAEDVVLLTLTGVYHGLDGVRKNARDLRRYLPDGDYEYRKKSVAGEYAYLSWHAQSPAGEVRDGCDGFVIRHGRIVAQMIHYTVDHGH